MKIGIIGSGDVGKSLAKGLSSLGHKTMIGTREPKRKELVSLAKKLVGGLEIGTTTEAASFGEICILAIAWNAEDDVISQIRPQLSGKVVIDVTNPLVFNESGPPELAVGHSISGGEIVQRSLPDSHVVKTLNIINHQNMIKPKFSEGKPTMFVCGNNKSAVNQTGRLLNEFGWEDVIDLGDIEKSRLLESLCLLWVEYGIAKNTWKHAFSVINK